MAIFSIAEKETGRFEGLYANNSADSGGETFAGIARNYWGNWEGWDIIDAIKKQYGTKAAIINHYAGRHPALTQMISKFYKTNFWDSLKLDQIKDQQLANTVYDFGVNSGTSRSAKTLQLAANDTGLIKLVVDGKIGANTISAVNSLNPALIHANYQKRRISFYREIAKGNQEQFLKSWLSRVKTYKPC